MRGSSAGAIWEISAEYPEARLTIGADVSAGWAIQAAGVQPVHLELFWDGTALWVADTHGAGGVFLDGQRVSEWMQIHGPAELRFGAASLDIETSAPAHEQMLSRPDQARPATVTDLQSPPERRSQPIFGGAASDDSIPELDAAATRVVASPALPAAPAAPPQASEGAMSDLRPRLGGQVVAGSAEATRMVAMPVAPPGRAPAPPPAAGYPAPGYPAPGHAPAPVVAPPPAQPSFGPLNPPMAPPAIPPPDPAYPAGLAPPEGAPAFVAPPLAPQAPPKPSPFAQLLQVLKPQSSADVVQASGGKKGQSLPTRTWIMLAVTIAAVAGLLLWPDDEPVGPPAPTATAVAQPTTPTAAPTTPTTATPTPPVPTPPPPTVEAPPSPPVAGESEGATEDEAGEVFVTSLQRQAADHFIAGRLPEALAIYRALAAAEPTNEAYASMVRILERRTRCRDGVGPGGEPCGDP